MNIPETQAFDQGREAFFASIPRTANPYPPLAEEHAAWNDGWDDAETHRDTDSGPKIKLDKTMKLKLDGVTLAEIPSRFGRYIKDLAKRRKGSCSQIESKSEPVWIDVTSLLDPSTDPTNGTTDITLTITLLFPFPSPPSEEQPETKIKP